MINKDKKKQELKLFIVRKYVMAKSVQDALKKEKNHLPDDCWLDEEYRRTKTQDKLPAIGFRINN